MAQQPGYYGTPSTVSSQRQTSKPRLRKIKLTIEDTAGTTWTTAGRLVTDPKERSAAAKTVGWIVSLLLLGAATLVSAWILGWVVSIVHAWWPFVPEMPFTVALKINLVILLGGVIGKFLAEFVRYALGIRRLPENDD